MTLRRKLLLTFLALAVAPIAVVAAILVAASLGVAERGAREQLGGRLETLASLVEREVEVERRSLEGMLSERATSYFGSSLQSPGLWLGRRSEVRLRLEERPNVTLRFVILTPGADSAVVVQGYFHPQGIGSRASVVPVGEVPDARRFLHSTKPVVSISQPVGDALAVVVPGRPAPAGPGIVLVEEISVIALLQRLTAQPAFEHVRSVYAAAADGERWRFVFHSDPGLIRLGLEDASWSRRIAAAFDPKRLGARGGWTAASTLAAPVFVRDRDDLHAALYVASIGWIIGGSLSLTPWLAPVRRMLVFTVSLLALMIGLVTVAILLVTRGIGGAVEEIAAGAGAQARGDLGRTIRIARRDEFGAIAEHVNQMARDLVLTAESRSIARLSSRLTHDLKGVASQMNLLLHNLERHPDDPEFRAEFVGLMRGLTGQVESLVLRLRRGGEDRLPRWERVDLDALLGEILAGPLPRAWPEITVRRELRSTAPVVADAEFVHRSIENVITNALEAMNGRGELRVAAGVLAPRPGRVATHFVEIDDTGPGMSEAFIREQLFRPFVTTKPKGTGLGMYQARQILQAMGGRIEVTSREGTGTRVRLELGRSESV